MRLQSAMSVGTTRVMTSGAALAITLLVVFIAPNVTSQPYVQPNVRTARPLSHLDTATSQPSSQSRRENFEWNTRRVGNKKVATISIRKDEERDRRSVPLGDVRAPFHKPPTASGAEELAKPSHAHRHHHGDDQWGAEGGRGGEGGGRRRVEQEEDYIGDERIGEGWAARGGVDVPPRHLVARTGALQQLQEEVSEEEDEEEEEEDDEEDEEGDDVVRATSLEASSRFHELLYATGMRADSLVFSNASEAQEQDDGGARKRRKRGKRGKKVKRDRKRRGREGKKKSKKKKKKKSKKCKKLKGKLKKKCKKDEEMLSFITRSITMSGNEACQYHNLEECYKKVGLVHGNTSLLKCRYREEFLECMEEQREGVCDPNFQTEGDMVALRNRIRDEIWTTNSCLITEVVEG
ncbi:YTH domain-containing protein 1-like [Penaeus indicus]|uniref:YTH domain-containing protein 1-like n=1 Tax=Penaeus indicus TaxID=29960 RepID=UPI00300C37A7